MFKRNREENAPKEATSVVQDSMIIILTQGRSKTLLVKVHRDLALKDTRGEAE